MKTSSFARSVRLLFFASGFCGLIYEVIWAKILHTIVGCSLHAVTLVMAAFMSGLALGSLLGGRLTRSRQSGLAVYAALEAGIGCFALVSPLLWDGLIPLYVGLHHLLDASVTLGPYAAVRAVLLGAHGARGHDGRHPPGDDPRPRARGGPVWSATSASSMASTRWAPRSAVSAPATC